MTDITSDEFMDRVFLFKPYCLVCYASYSEEEAQEMAQKIIKENNLEVLPE